MKRPAWLASDLRRVEQLMIETAGDSIHPLVSEPSVHLLKAGGKRLRPALVVIGSKLGTGQRRGTDLAAAAIELVHLATLYHDDVMDGTDMRRGVPTAHARWGIEVAVLAGDYLFARACGLGAVAGGEVPSILARAIGEVCEGQIVETGFTGDPARTLDDYLGTIRLKTAALFKASCELGAATSGARASTRTALVAYGESLGLAFQVVDDLLDIVGDPQTTGKVPGTDLRKGVFTAPLLIAAERAPDLAARLSAGERELADILPVLHDTGALANVFDIAAGFAGDAYEALDALPEGETKALLATTVDGVLAQIERSAA
ncbi:MAG TPA: polyprenyl synthetase family protein [Actinomycetota bacterium]|jgi:heptaprenyl diphosphate synthase|nr:polyprenyl synthetase family protein [Actinomycetota bacterium]